MTLQAYIAYFFAGAFLANAIPHFVNGVSGRRFPERSPFKKSGRILSSVERILFSSIGNVIWGIFNAVVGCVLLNKVGTFTVGFTSDMLIALCGFTACALFLAWNIGRVHGGLK